MQKRKIGNHASTFGVCCNPRKSAPYPFWNTSTNAPYAAPTESRFIMIAVTGTTIDRKTTSKRIKLNPSTKVNTHGVTSSTAAK